MLRYCSSILLITLLLASCGSKKRLVYFQGEDSIGEATTTYAPVFKADDYVSVVVTADDSESAVPFNFPQEIVGQNQMRMGGGGMQLGMPVTNGYLVDDEGFIDLPVIGKTQVAGLNRKELKAALRQQYEQYLTNPIVNIKILNFRVTVLGDVKQPGVKIIPNERISIVEAIALAGDLNPTAVRNNVLVIREREGVRSEFRVDLTSKSALTSPVYYLEQNDLVYIEPNLAARTQGTFWRSTLPTVISLATVAVTTVLLILN